jgi:hypothetical protein
MIESKVEWEDESKDAYYEELNAPLERRLRPPGQKKKRRKPKPPLPPPPEERQLAKRLQDPYASLHIDGLLLAWGWNNSGQLGIGNKDDLSEMQTVVDTDTVGGWGVV